jgi:hypothetical protein
MLATELKKLTLQSEIISIERDCHDEELTGILCDTNFHVTTMHLYTNEGEYDGFTVFETNQITEVFWGNREHKAIAHLVKKNAAVKAPKLVAKEFPDIMIELGTKYSSLCFHPVNFEDKFDIGVIKKHDKEWLKIRTFGVKKSLSRLYKLLLKESISRIVVDSPYQNQIVELHATKL